ncbi:D-lactate dehydrogenase [Motiliproteus coralliicola]|uniref:Quinone-dependent D-lactate dehydrogenase n=1 Tax=Motiliproteus coralliicola TaxID=2283196 RepID=A0A369WKC1_9GAMM|nr:D-lactate dehydrogenase [Motiliproteus coralliicola]RDE19905.1 D-lactate dehydrogenase [Motiliproteus coralliicola]
MSAQQFIDQLTTIVGRENIKTGERQTEHYRKGFRSGEGDALAVVFPTTLLQQWRVLKACVEADKIIIMQAANTGLTEGSTPSGEDYDRDIIILNTTRMDSIYLLDEGRQIISLPGATLFKLEKLLKPLNRAPHSVIGSSCIGASIIGGIANNSGGALVKRGPAYSELSLFARISDNGELELVNHLGIELGDSPEEMLQNLEQQNFSTDGQAAPGKASASDYPEILRDVDADTPARFNADTRRLYEASGCAGKLAIFAVRLDTFEVPQQEQVYYIGTNDPAQLTQLRRDILKGFKNLPEVGEYMHRDVFDIALKYGKDTFLMINYLGTDPLPKLFAVKGSISAWLNRFSFLPKELPDRVMQIMSRCWPNIVPKRLMQFRDDYEHHLILKMSDEGIDEADAYLKEFFSDPAKGGYIACSADEAKKAYLLRFAAAGAAIRYETVHHKEVENILALDIALKRNDEDWVEKLPESITSQLVSSLYYGHFMCHVFHQDYILKKGADAKAIKQQMLDILAAKGAKYPAEHNVGHLYEAESGLKNFYAELDPTNTFNPGIGKTSKRRCGC